MNKINETVARLKKKKKREDTITNIRNERGDINTDFTAIKRIIREYCEPYHIHKFYNLEEINQFPERHRLPKHSGRNR